MRKMLARLAAAAIVVALSFAPALVQAQSLPLDPNGNVKVIQQGTITVIQPSGSNLHIICDGGCVGTAGWSYYAVPATTACVTPNVCVIKNAPGVLAGLINPSTTAQSTSNTCTLYDNATAASGQALFAEAGIGAGQIVSFGGSLGMKTTAGLAIQCSATPTGLGLVVLFS